MKAKKIYKVENITMMRAKDKMLAFAKSIGKTDQRPVFPFSALPTVQNAFPSSSPVDVFKIHLAKQIAELVGSSIDKVFASINYHRETAKADLSIPLPRILPKSTPERFNEVAKGFVCDEYVVDATLDSNYLNFKINHTILRYLLLQAITQNTSAYGKNKTGANKTACIDFSSPNIAKPFHMGHVRSTILGNVLRNVLNENGWKTVAYNYLGDWGKQYGLLAVGFNKYGDPEKLKSKADRHLFEVYVKINNDAAETAVDEEDFVEVKAAETENEIHRLAREYFVKMENGDEAALAQWQMFRNMSIVQLEQIYRRLGLCFDVYSGESQVKSIDKIIHSLESKNLLVESDGAQIVDLTDAGLGKPIVVKRDGAKLYFTRDIASAVDRVTEYGCDRLYYVVGAQQNLHFRQLFCTLERMGFSWAKNCYHYAFGMVKGMSTRKGNAVFLEDVLNCTRDTVLQVMQKNQKKYEKIDNPVETADIIGVSALIAQDLNARRIKDYKFDLETMLSFEGDTGPYLQYAHVRLCSIERGAGTLANSSKLFEEADLSVLGEYGENASVLIDRLVLLLSKYPEIVRGLAEEFEPCTLLTYLFNLCHVVSSLYEEVRALDNDMRKRKTAVLLYMCARITLGNGLRVLGMQPLEQM